MVTGRGRGGAPAAAAICALVLLACAGDEPRCGRLPACDIRADACQQQVLAIAACARGDSAARVPIRVRDFNAYVDEQVAHAAETEPEARARREQLYAGLARLGLVPSGLTLEGAVERDIDWVGAFYTSEEREIVVLDRGNPLEGLPATGLLLHELVHALQDAAHDLDALYDAQPEGRDGATGLSALIEGEAVVHTDRALADAYGYDPEDIDWDELYRGYGARGSRALADSDGLLFDVDAWFVYAFGARYVNSAYERRGGASLAALYEAPPVSARQVALGEGRPEPDRGPWLDPELDEEALPPAPEGFQLLGVLRLGAYLAHLFATRPDARRTRRPLAETACDHLRGDVLTVLQGPDGEQLVTWRLRFSAVKHAFHYLGAISELAADEAWSSDRDVIIAAASDPELLEALVNEPWQPLPREQEEPERDDEAGAPAQPRPSVFCRLPLLPF